MKEVQSFETAVSIYLCTQRNIPEDSNLQQGRTKNITKQFLLLHNICAVQQDTQSVLMSKFIQHLC